MRNKKVTLSILLLLGIGLIRLQAQEAVLTTGGNISGTGGSASYSIGQVVYTTITGTNGSVAQGVQQPFEISEVIGIKEAEGITLTCTAYPNPAKDYLTLKVNNYDISNLSYQLYDINGKLLENKKIAGNETTIDMNHLATATYFLKIIQSNKEVKTFKIIKTQ